MLETKNLSLVYNDAGKERKIIDNVDLVVNQGDVVVVLGPSGSGKSSLIYLLSCLKKPSEGEILLNGMSLSKSKDSSKIRYEKFGFIFQQHFLIPYLTTLENVMVAQKEELKNEAVSILEKLGLGQHLKKKPYQLSGGQRQRVAIARAMVKKPSIVFADEPTAALDRETANIVMELLRNTDTNITLIMATHDISLLKHSDRVFKINNGHLTETTISHSDLTKNNLNTDMVDFIIDQ